MINITNESTPSCRIKQSSSKSFDGLGESGVAFKYKSFTIRIEVLEVLSSVGAYLSVIPCKAG